MTFDTAASPWSRLWQTGVLHSCATGIQGNYDGAILAFWQRQFDALEDRARIVDLGTGNGPLLLLARERAGQRDIDLELHGVDIADIDPAGAVADGARLFAGIHFHPRTSACALPFADGEVDMVCSQFGFEYAPRDAAIDEILRVTRARNRISLVVHSDDSIVAQVAVHQRAGCAFLRDACPIVEQASAMVPVLFQAAQARGAHRGPTAESVRLAFNRSAKALMDTIEAMPEAQVLRKTAQQIRIALEYAAHSPQQADVILTHLGNSLQDEDVRLQQLQAALLSPADLDALARRLNQHGYQVRHASMEQLPGLKVGWTVEAVRA